MEKEREMKLTWSNKDSIMTCTRRHIERDGRDGCR